VNICSNTTRGTICCGTINGNSQSPWKAKKIKNSEKRVEMMLNVFSGSFLIYRIIIITLQINEAMESFLLYPFVNESCAFCNNGDAHECCRIHKKDISLTLCNAANQQSKK